MAQLPALTILRPETVPIPEIGQFWKKLPSYEQVPRLHSVAANHVSFPAHKAQLEADTALLDALVVGGFGEKYAPWKGEWLAVCLAGAVSFALNGTLIDPVRCDTFIRGGGDERLFKGLWQFVWMRLRLRKQNVFVSPAIKSSLYRLMVAHSHDQHWDNQAAQLWWDFKYCPDDSHGWGEMPHSVYKRARPINSFPEEDQLFLTLLAEGLGEMLALVKKVVPRLY